MREGRSKSWTLRCDGGARGNPGPAAIGYLLLDPEGRTVESRADSLGTATNNVAEYRALIAGLEAAARHHASRLTVCMDSGRGRARRTRSPTGSSTTCSTESWVPSLPGDRGCRADASAQAVAEAGARGKSELHRARCWVTPRGREPTESATESRPPTGAPRKLGAAGKGETVR